MGGVPCFEAPESELPGYDTPKKAPKATICKYHSTRKTKDRVGIHARFPIPDTRFPISDTRFPTTDFRQPISDIRKLGGKKRGARNTQTLFTTTDRVQQGQAGVVAYVATLPSPPCVKNDRTARVGHGCLVWSVILAVCLPVSYVFIFLLSALSVPTCLPSRCMHACLVLPSLPEPVCLTSACLSVRLSVYQPV